MKKILIVDDEHDIEPLFQQRFRQELKEGKFEFKFCFSAEEALEYIQNLHEPDLLMVLSDINMPGMSGLDLLRQIKRDHEAMKVLMITAYGDSKNRQDAMHAGAADFMIKPINFNLLKERLEKL